jgi:phage tail protein X
MKNQIEYTTQDGDRWDLIAYKHYGDAAQIGPIQRVNLHVPLSPVLPAGITLRIPVLESAQLDLNVIAPWNR